MRLRSDYGSINVPNEDLREFVAYVGIICGSPKRRTSDAQCINRSIPVGPRRRMRHAPIRFRTGISGGRLSLRIVQLPLDDGEADRHMFSVLDIHM